MCPAATPAVCGAPQTQCCDACSVRTWFQALEKAKDAGRKERVLVRQREQVTTPENTNLDLTYSVSDASGYVGRICSFQKAFVFFYFLSGFLLF